MQAIYKIASRKSSSGRTGKLVPHARFTLRDSVGAAFGTGSLPFLIVVDAVYAVRSLYDRAIISGISSRNLAHSGIFNAMPVRPGRRTACLFMNHCRISMQRIPVVTQMNIFPPICDLKSISFCEVASLTALSIGPIHILSWAQRSSGSATPFRPHAPISPVPTS